MEKTWYVIAYDQERAHPDRSVWTVSHHPEYEGWETDAGTDGYGLRKAEAQELVDAANTITSVVKQLKEANQAIAILIKGILPFADAINCENNIYKLNTNIVTTENYKNAYIAYKTVIKQAKGEIERNV